MGKVDYDARLHEVYAKGRALPAEALTAWGDAFERAAPPERPLTAIDVGSGVGRFTSTLAARFGGPSVGVEPSARMRAVAQQQEGKHPSVTYVEGRAEAIPLDDDAADIALLFLVWHHVDDHAAAALELARVVRSGGTLLLRTNFSDGTLEPWWYDSFPRLREIDAAMYPPRHELERILGEAGWRPSGAETVSYVVTSSHAEYVDRLETRSLSTFEYLTDDEIQRGLARLRASVATADPGPVGEAALLLSYRLG